MRMLFCSVLTQAEMPAKTLIFICPMVSSYALALYILQNCMLLYNAYSKYLRHRRHRKSHLKSYETSPSSPFIIPLVILTKAKSFVNKISLVYTAKTRHIMGEKPHKNFLTRILNIILLVYFFGKFHTSCAYIFPRNIPNIVISAFVVIPLLLHCYVLGNASIYCFYITYIFFAVACFTGCMERSR